jgi:hypothetical protein
MFDPYTVHDLEKHDLYSKTQLTKNLYFAIFCFFFMKSNKSPPYSCVKSNIGPF